MASSTKNSNGHGKARSAVAEQGSRGAGRPIPTPADWLTSFAESVDEFIWLIDPHSGKVLYANSAFEHIFGRPVETYMADLNSVADMIHPDDWASLRAVGSRMLREPGEYVYRIIRPDGDLRWLSTHVYPVMDENGEAALLGGMTHDITDLKQAIHALQDSEAALQESEAAREAILDAIPDMIFRVSRTGVMLDAHVPESARLLVDPEKVRGRLLRDLLPATMLKPALVSFEAAFETRQIQTLDVPDEFGLGLIFEAQIAASPPDEALVVVRDVTERRRAEEALHRSEAARMAIIDALPDMIFRLRSDGVCLDVHFPDGVASPAPPAQFIGRHFSEFVGAESGQMVQNAIRAALQTGNMRVYESDDATAPDRFHETRVLASGPDEVLMIVRDITEQKLAEAALRYSEEARKAIFDALPDMILRVGADGLVLDGHAPEDWKAPPASTQAGRKLQDIFPADFARLTRQALDQAFQTRKAQVFEAVGPFRRELIAQVRVMVSGGDEALIIIGDVTERARAEEAFHRSEAAREAMLEALPDLIFRISRDGVYLDVSASSATELPMPAERMIGQHIDEVMPQSYSDTLMGHLGEAFAHPGTVVVYESVDAIQPEIYRERRIMVSGPDEAIMIVRDITEAHQAQAAIRASESRFRSLFENSPDAIMLLDPHAADVSWPIVDCNEIACEASGFTREELIGQSIDVLHNARPRPREREEYLERLRSEGAFRGEVMHRRKDGTFYPVMYSTTLIRLGERELVLGIDRDITDRKRSEEALQASEQRFRLLAERAPVGIFETEPNGRMTYVNPRWMILTGRVLEQVTNRDRMMEIFHPDDAQRVTQGWDKAREERAEWYCEYRYLRPDGEVVWVAGNATPVRDELGEYVGYMGTVVDITQLKHAEEAERGQRRLTEALRDTAAAINSTLDLEVVLRLLLEKLSSVVPHESANVMLIENGHLRIGSSHGYGEKGPSNILNSGDLTFKMTPILREAAQKREPLLVSRVADDPRWIPSPERDIRSYVVAPIVRDDQVLGFINLDSRISGFFTEDHLPPLKAFADQAAVALNNASVYTQAQQEITDRRRAEAALWQQNDYLAGLHEVTLGLVQQVDQATRYRTIVTRTAGLLDAQDVFLAVVEPGGEQMRMEYAIGRYEAGMGDSIAPSQGQTGIAWQTGRSQMMPDLGDAATQADNPAWLRAVISTPLKIGDEVIGVLEAGFDHPVDLDLERVFYLERFAELAALTFHNGRLYEQAQQEIMDRTRAEIALAVQRDFAQQVMQALGQGLIITNEDNRIEYTNPAFARLVGREVIELAWMETTELVHPDDREAVREHFDERIEGFSSSYEARLVRPDGTTLPALVTGTPRRQGDLVVGAIAVVTDLTEQKKNEQALKQQAAELTALYRASGGLIQAGRTPADLATELTDAIAEEMSATHASIWMISGDGKSLELTGQARRPYPASHHTYPVDGPGLLVESYRTGLPIYSPDVLLDARYIEVLPRTRSKLVIPLKTQGQIVGVFTVERETTNAFDEVSRRLFTVFAEQVGMALENMALIGWLTSARKSAEDANRAKSDFLANMSHEIRTPLNGVLGIIELVLGTELSQGQRNDLNIAQQSAESLLGLINDILDLSKIEAGRLELEEVDFDLPKLVDQTIKMVEPRLKSGVALTRKIGPKVPRALRGDPIRLRQVLVNLLGNAAKFTSQGSVSLRVTVKQRSAGKVMLHFEVADTGIGIPQDQIVAIFEPFSQVDTSTTRRFGGTGLGLTIVRRLVDKFGGVVWVRSVLGEGSSFHFTARLAISDAQLAEPAEIKPAEELAQQLGKLRILVAEDNRVNQHVMSGMLSKRNWEVAVAGDGRQAADLALAGGFDVILMDVQMPAMDGFQVTALIRQAETPKGLHTPIIALTAHAMQGDRERCIAAGMDDYLSKPVRMEELYATIETVLTGRKVVQEDTQPARPALAVFDRAEALHYIGEDEDLLSEVLVIFRNEWPADMKLLEQAARAGDLKSVALIAHRMKGQSGVLGGQQTRAAALEAETAAKTENLEAARKAIRKLKAAVKRLDQAVAAELKAHPPASGPSA